MSRLPHLNDHFLKLAEENFTFPTWHGFRVVAADATTLRLTQQFITATGKRAVRHILDAIGFALYLPGIEMTLAATLYLPTVGERGMLMDHLHKLRTNDVLVLDRGYPAGWLIAALLQRGIHFCMRADGLNFGVIQAFRRSNLPEQIITLPALSETIAQRYGIASKPSTVRLVRQVFGSQAAYSSRHSSTLLPIPPRRSANSTTPGGGSKRLSSDSNIDFHLSILRV